MHAMRADRAGQGLVNPPCPRLPTTSSSAPSDASSNTRAGLPSATVDLAQAQLPRPRRALPPAMTQTRQPAPRLTVSSAIARLEALGHEFLFFVDTDTSRGSLIYHRYDGHYGLIVPVDVPH